MVYRGKPSLGCYLCRSRRIKCDQKRLGCSQCANVGTQCPGYRNALDLMFRDETDTTQQKARSKAKKIHSANAAADLRHAHDSDGSEVATSSSSSSSSGDAYSPPGSMQVWAPVKPSPQLVQSPSLHVDDVALSFFLGMYVNGSRFEYMPPLYGSSFGTDAPLYFSVKAASLASLSQELEYPEIASLARNYYARALHSTNTALASPREAVRNETLASVLVLSLFETITQTDASSRASWEAHVNGAAVLLKLRGLDQFQSKLGQDLYLHAADSIRIKCFQLQLPVPEHLIALDQIAAPFVDEIAVHLSSIVNGLAGLRAELQELGAAEPYRLIELLRGYESDVLSLESLLFARVESDAQYQICQADAPTPSMFNNTYHLYRSHRLIRLWNTIRMLKVYLNECVWRSARKAASKTSPLSTEYPLDIEALRTAAAERALGAALEICASVPQLMGDVHLPGSTLPPCFGSTSALIWPLNLIAESDNLSLELRMYAIRQLRLIGQTKKIPQAAVLADTLEQTGKTDLWVHMYHT